MEVMRLLFVGLALTIAAVGQDPVKPRTKPVTTPGQTGGSIAPVNFGPNGWPTGKGNPAPAPAVESQKKPARGPVVTPSERQPTDAEAQLSGIANQDQTTVASRAQGGEPLASGMQLDSHMHEIFRATRSPGAFRAINGVEVLWSLSVHGSSGEIIGSRMITHVANCNYAERDRIERTGGVVYVRVGKDVVAHKNGIPYEVLDKQASSELELFGAHLRMPWCFGEGQRYVIMSRSTIQSRGEKLWQLELHGRPQGDESVFGPVERGVLRDHFFIRYEPSTGQPREFIHRFVSSGQQRRVLLEDWQDVYGVRMPKRRIYVDSAGRPTTTIEMISISRRRTSDRDFRVL